jgi:hypothetical protein
MISHGFPWFSRSKFSSSPAPLADPIVTKQPSPARAARTSWAPRRAETSLAQQRKKHRGCPAARAYAAEPDQKKRGGAGEKHGFLYGIDTYCLVN